MNTDKITPEIINEISCIAEGLRRIPDRREMWLSEREPFFKDGNLYNKDRLERAFSDLKDVCFHYQLELYDTFRNIALEALNYKEEELKTRLDELLKKIQQ